MAVDAGVGGVAAQGSAPFRVFFIPVFVPSHTIPMAELAYQFAARGVDSTMVVTPANGAVIRRTVDRAIRAGHPLRTLHYAFPSVAAGLPEGVEDAAAILTGDVAKIYRAAAAVQSCHDRILREHRPNAVVADFPYWWTNDTARDLGIPRVMYHVIGAFPKMVLSMVAQYRPQDGLADGDNGPFLVPHLPDRVEMVVSELPGTVRVVSDIAHEETAQKARKSEQECFGVVLNTVYELEPAYCDLFRQTQCQRAWFCGPCTLWPRDDREEEEEERTAASEKGHHCVAWLDKQATASVVYVGFGSILHFGKKQQQEMAKGLEASGRPFLWMRKGSDIAGSGEGWVPDEGFEDRVRGRGLVVGGWVPQATILNHPATGAFVTHLGWNSMTEGLHAGLPMITWPLAFEQFFTERLVVDILRVGVRMWEGFRSSLSATGDDERALVTGEAIARALSRFATPGCADEEVEAMRKRAGEYGAMIGAAVREGGSSYNDLTGLIDALKAFRPE